MTPNDFLPSLPPSLIPLHVLLRGKSVFFSLCMQCLVMFRPFSPLFFWIFVCVECKPSLCCFPPILEASRPTFCRKCPFSNAKNIDEIEIVFRWHTMGTSAFPSCSPLSGMSICACAAEMGVENSAEERAIPAIRCR